MFPHQHVCLTRLAFGALRRLTSATLLVAATATCDGANVLGPVGANAVEFEWLSDTLLFVEGRAAPVIRVVKDGVALEAPRLLLISGNPDIVATTAGGDSLHARRLGSTDVTVRLLGSLLPEAGVTWTRSVHVILKEFGLDRSLVAFTSVGDTATLRAISLGADDRPVDVVVEWRSLDTNRVTVSGGRVTARGTGATDVLAIAGRDTARATVTVEQRLAQFVLTPEVLTLSTIGESGTINAAAVDNSGAEVPGVTPFWESGNASIVRVDATGRVTAIGSGSTTIYAFKGPVRSSATVHVRQRATRVVLPDQAPPITSVNDTLRLSATAYDAAGAPISDPARVVWSSQQPGIASVDRGLVRAQSRGTAFIVASMDGAADTVAVEVRNDAVTMTLSPADTALGYIGESALLRARAFNALGAEITDATFTWSSSDTTTVAVDASGRILARAVTNGTKARVTARSGATASVATVSVFNLPAVIDFAATADTLDSLLETATPAIQILNRNGDPLPRTAVQWESAQPAVASVDAAGVVTARDTGATYVKAFANGIRDSLWVLVRNRPASVVLTPVSDTLTRAGQQLTYSASVRNALGAVIPGYPVAWRTDNTSVATVSSSGTVTAAGFGTARVIAEAGAAADTSVLIVRNLTQLHVNNSATATPAIGTRARPYPTIATALADATVGDTVVVWPGNRAYAEPVQLAGQISLIGSDSAFRANANNPAFLPTITHDAGPAGVRIEPGASVLVRHLAIRHLVDGPAIDADGASVRLENIHVNPGQTSRVGRGFRIANASGTVIADATVNAVVGYGVLFSGVTSGAITRVRITGVDSVAGANGEGIRIVRGSGNTIEWSSVRATMGVRLLLDSTAGARVMSDTLAGRHRLLRIRSASGATLVSGNAFDLTQQGSDAPSSGSAGDGRAALEILQSGGVSLTGNSFLEVGGTAMDAVRMIDARGSGVTMTSNLFRGGRYQIRSTRSTWTLTGSLLENAVRAIVAEEADSVTMTSDTLRNVVGRGCVDVRGSAMVSVVGGWLASCTSASADTGMAAITVEGASASLSVRNTRFTGANETAIAFTGASLVVQNASFAGSGTRTVPVRRWPAAIMATATLAEITGSTIVDYRTTDGASLAAATVRVENNRWWKNRRGVEVRQWTTATISGNDFADHTIGALANLESPPLSAQPNWWGDGRGPRRLLNADAVGDSVIGLVNFGTPAAVAYAPGAPGSEDSLRIVRGDGQSGPRNTTLPLRLTARVTDVQGRPVAGVSVRFRIVSGNGSVDGSGTADKISDASGLAEVRLTLGSSAGSVTVEAAYGNGVRRRVVTFTATAQ